MVIKRIYEERVCPMTGETFTPTNGSQKYSERGREMARKNAAVTYRAENLEYVKAYQRQWRKEHAVETKASQKATRAAAKKADPIGFLAKQAKVSRDRRAKDPEAYREYINNYMSNRPIVIDGVEYAGYRSTPKNLAYARSFQSESYHARMHKKPLSEGAWQALFDFQHGKCAICCEDMDNPHEDHDPVLGQTRGLLCVGCNTGLGYLRDNSLLAKKLVEAQVRGKLKRNAQINRILGRFNTIEKLLSAAEFLENPTYSQCFKGNDNCTPMVKEPTNWSWQQVAA